MSDQHTGTATTRPVEKTAKLVLIVDDEFDITSMFAMLFQLHGYETLTAGNGRQALELLAKQRPDLILSDCMMPDMDGLELARQVRNDRGVESIPLILMSAIPLSKKPSDAGVDVFLLKPLKFKDLLAAVERLLDASPDV